LNINDDETVIFTNIYSYPPAKLALDINFIGITSSLYPNALFTVIGVNASGEEIYNRTIHYDEFNDVSDNGRPIHILDHLAAGTYTVVVSVDSVRVNGYSLNANTPIAPIKLDPGDEDTAAVVEIYNRNSGGGGNAARYDMKIEKNLADGQSSEVTPGAEVKYVIRITNTGNTTLTNVKVTDEIEGNTYDVGTISSLAANRSGDFTFTYTVPADAKQGTTIRNTAIAEQTNTGKRSDYADITVVTDGTTPPSGGTTPPSGEATPPSGGTTPPSEEPMPPSAEPTPEPGDPDTELPNPNIPGAGLDYDPGETPEPEITPNPKNPVVQGKNQGNEPKTGDDSQTTLFFILFCLACIVAISSAMYLLVSNRRRKQTERV